MKLMRMCSLKSDSKLRLTAFEFETMIVKNNHLDLMGLTDLNVILCQFFARLFKPLNLHDGSIVIRFEQGIFCRGLDVGLNLYDSIITLRNC